MKLVPIYLPFSPSSNIPEDITCSTFPPLTAMFRSQFGQLILLKRAFFEHFY